MTTLKEIFALTPETEQKDSNENWNKIKAKIDEEIKGIEWIKFSPDLVKNMGKLLDIDIPDIFIDSWKKGKAIQDALLESKQIPEKTIEIELDQHIIECKLNPYIEIRIMNLPQPKRINFTLCVSFDLKKFVLKIQNGSINEIQTGSCEMTGTFECESILIAEKKSEPIKLPDLFTFTMK